MGHTFIPLILYHIGYITAYWLMPNKKIRFPQQQFILDLIQRAIDFHNSMCYRYILVIKQYKGCVLHQKDVWL
jgi:hypothetical protein